MKTRDVIEGLQIFQKYRDRQDGYDVGAEHDVLYAYKTDRPLEEMDLKRILELGWHQDVEYAADDGGDMQPGDYDPDQGWACYT